MPALAAAHLSGPIHLLVNPAAGNGRARHQTDRAYAALRTIGPVKVVESTRPRDETRLATEAVHANAKALVVLGGDGSVTHAARGLIATHSHTPLAIFAAGTGNDFAKSLHIPAHDYLAMARLIASGTSRLIDAAEIDGVPFVNAAGFGFDVDVLQRTKDPRRRPRMLRGTTLYVVTALQQLFRYRGFSASVSALHHGASRDWLTVVFANGQWFGGAFRIAPDALLNNGMLDVIGIANAPAATRAMLFARAPRGAHITHHAVSTARAAEFTLTSLDALHFQADGEPHHASSRTVRIRSLPNALRVIAP
ncbi:MAG: diacylglycerol kinase family lipid kinase [Gemmatimonadaceae bacterium]|nr:diacylglycerol kinase family lipid kinase [Gemmatimonadaceae bacterium]